ncbi:MAG: T9SS type A sorting domain-containing protein [Candidatus Eisenbacteria sp.]|nr:T9SS type A sorting domain-containing protein [Candidatus Eisenbacteria bacterium]
MKTHHSLRHGGSALLILLALLLCRDAESATLKLWWDNFEDGNKTCWLINQSGATIEVDSTVANGGDYSLKVTGASAQGQYARAYSRTLPINFNQDYTVQFAFRWSSFHWDRFLIFGHIRLLLDQTWLPILYDPVGDNSFVDNQLSGDSFSSYLPANRWAWITVHCQPSIRKYWVFVDGTLIGTVNYQAGLMPASQFFLEDNGSWDNFLNAWYDDFSVWGIQKADVADFIKPGLATDPENDCVAWAHPPAVPYHGQYTYANPNHPLNEPCSPPRPNGRCMLACLEMVFDRFGDNLPPANVMPNPQEEIAAAANTNDRVNCPNGNWLGTSQSDLRRAGHFSSATTALTGTRNQCSPPDTLCPNQNGASGYTWRDLGYSVVDSIWTVLAPEDTVEPGIHPVVLEDLLASGYPIIALIDPPEDYCDSLYDDGSEGFKDDENCPPEDTLIGHAVVLMGYDNFGLQGGNTINGPAFLIHDPAVAKSQWISQAYFWNHVWTGKRFIFAAPWEAMLLWQPSVGFLCKFDGTLLVTYPGPKPLDGFYPVANAKGKLKLTCLGRQGGEALTHNLQNIAVTGDWDYSTWKLTGPAPGGFVANPVVDYTAWGTLSPAVSSRSYQNYADEIGSVGTDWRLLQGWCFGIVDPGHFGWPYGDHWWDSGGSGIHLSSPGGPTHEISVAVGNFGLDPIPAGAVCRLYYEDPTAAESAPGEYYIGEIPIPTLAPGDTMTVGPIPWTAPPANGFGEPYFSLWSEIECPGDPPESNWPLGENNYATLADFELPAHPGSPVSMHFWITNPEPTAMQMILEIEKEEAAAGWTVALDQPVGIPMTFGPLESRPAEITVTPSGGGGGGRVHVESYLYIPGGDLVRETGGITLTFQPVTSVSEVDQITRPRLVLDQNTPNPFNPVTTIGYSIPRDGRVSLQVFDVTGRLVRTLVDGHQSAGAGQVIWQGKDNNGAPVASGVYFYRLSVEGEKAETRKMVLLR